MSEQQPQYQPYDVLPDNSVPGVPPAGTVARIKGSKNQFHAFKVYDKVFVNDVRYRPRRGLGRGAYGIVVSAYDQDRENIKVAIKRVLGLFDGELIDAKRIVREIKLLAHLSHENVVGLVDLYPSPGPLRDINLVMDFMDTDLHNIIYSDNVLSDDHLQFFMYQLLRGLKYIHSANVIHRDLKPANLLVNGQCHLKIADFGLARGYGGGQASEDQYLTEYVVTRWYRAPEIMCQAEAYDYKIDVWAAGCIFAEMFLRSPLFPGEDYKKQLNVIFDIIGTPSQEDLKCVTNEYALQYINELPVREAIPFEALFNRKDINKDALDLLTKLLQFNPAKRLSIDEALAHPWFEPYHSTQSEPVAEKVWDSSFEADLQDNDLTKEKLVGYFLAEIYKYRPELKQYFDRGSFYGEELYKKK